MERRRLAFRPLAILAAGAFAELALAQRGGENAVTSADGAFGTSVGNETIGLYITDEVRGFSPALGLQVSNLFDDYAWNVTGGGGFRRAFPRRANLTLSIDF